MDEDLTEAQRVELVSRLRAAEREVEGGLAGSAEDSKPVDLELSIGRLSRVDAMQQQQMALARRKRAELQLQQIRQGLARVVDGSYGACVVCGESIGFRRLRARPETPACHDCQSNNGG